MRNDEIIKIFERNANISKSLSLSDFAEINKFAKIDLQIDEINFMYSYYIFIDDLAKSEITMDKLMEMKKNGWYLGKDKKKIILDLN